MSNLVEEFADTLVPVSEHRTRREAIGLPRNLQDSYLYFLSLCDGGYTKDGFLHLLGLEGDPRHNLIDWNDVNKWKRYYSLDERCFVFAEDLFGSQYFFDIRGNRRVVKMLLPSIGRTSLYTNSFEDFVEQEGLSVNFSQETRRLAAGFLAKNSLKPTPFTHISCKKPVLLGGSELDLDNLELADSLTNLRLTGQILQQVKKLPKGTRIDSVKIEEE